MTTLLIAIVVLLILALICFPEFRSLLSGFGKKFVQDAAKTPEGAEAAYTKAIDEKRDAYTRAKKYHSEVTGKLERAKNNLENAKQKKKHTEETIERCFASGRGNDAEVFVTELEIANDNIKTFEAAVKQLTPLQEQARQLQEELETQLKKLESEKKIIINKIRLNKDSAELYEGLDDLAAIKSSDKLLKAVREGAEELEDRSVGARTVHESKASTKAQKLKKEMGSAEVNDFMTQMQAKYAKK